MRNVQVHLRCGDVLHVDRRGGRKCRGVIKRALRHKPIAIAGWSSRRPGILNTFPGSFGSLRSLDRPDLVAHATDDGGRYWWWVCSAIVSGPDGDVVCRIARPRRSLVIWPEDQPHMEVESMLQAATFQVLPPAGATG